MMSTPSLTRHVLPGALGDINIDVRTSDRKNPRPAVIIVHGFKGFKDWGMFPMLAERLSRAGITAVSFNMSGSGVDDGGDFSLPDQFGHNTYSAELRDLDRVARAVAAGQPLGFPQPSSFGILGHSRGGGIAILHAARDASVRALVTWSAIGSVDRWSAGAKEAWRRRGFLNIQNARTGQVMPLSTDVLDDIEANAVTLDILAAAGRVRAPWLIVHGDADETVQVDDAQNLDARAGADHRLLIIPGGGHTFGAAHPMKELSVELDRAMTESVGWFARYLS
jgi:dienelactone hydrolase